MSDSTKGSTTTASTAVITTMGTGGTSHESPNNTTRCSLQQQQQDVSPSSSTSSSNSNSPSSLEVAARRMSRMGARRMTMEEATSAAAEAEVERLLDGVSASNSLIVNPTRTTQQHQSDVVASLPRPAVTGAAFVNSANSSAAFVASVNENLERNGASSSLRLLSESEMPSSSSSIPSAVGDESINIAAFPPQNWFDLARSDDFVFQTSPRTTSASAATVAAENGAQDSATRTIMTRSMARSNREVDDTTTTTTADRTLNNNPFLSSRSSVTRNALLNSFAQRADAFESYRRSAILASNRNNNNNNNSQNNRNSSSTTSISSPINPFLPSSLASSASGVAAIASSGLSTNATTTATTSARRPTTTTTTTTTTPLSLALRSSRAVSRRAATVTATRNRRNHTRAVGIQEPPVTRSRKRAASCRNGSAETNNQKKKAALKKDKTADDSNSTTSETDMDSPIAKGVKRRKQAATKDANAKKSDDTTTTSASESNDEDKRCCICLEQPSKQELSKLDGCKHIYCFSCIEKWAERENKCPQCKARFNKITRVHKKRGAATKGSSASKNVKKVKNRDQRSDFAQGMQWHNLLSRMEQSGTFPTPFAQFIFSSLGHVSLDNPNPRHMANNRQSANNAMADDQFPLRHSSLAPMISDMRNTLHARRPQSPTILPINMHGRMSPDFYDSTSPPDTPGASASRINGSSATSTGALADSDSDDDNTNALETRFYQRVRNLSRERNSVMERFHLSGLPFAPPHLSGPNEPNFFHGPPFDAFPTRPSERPQSFASNGHEAEAGVSAETALEIMDSDEDDDEIFEVFSAPPSRI